ncbi:MAG: 30S ribosomal protein S16 [Patescibacteria group bacterium]|nr:30S ribosomal protein S16 [Patescibacteria group bacterium]
MLVIRLFRIGKKNQPFFKIIITDKRRSSTGGRFIEEVGFWNPLKKEKVLKSERIKYWLSVGAKPSASVYNLLISEKILEGKKIPRHKKAEEKREVEEEKSEEPAKTKETENKKSITT